MRVINFNPGPAGLPLPALEKCRDELLDFHGSGMSVMEHSHRGKIYDAVHNETKERLTRLLKIPPTHQILFLTGGASQQFATVPMNFLRTGQSADYVVTGGWSEKAVDEAVIIGNVRIACTTKNADGRFYRVPTQSEVTFDPNAAYVHSTSNNTLFGTQFHTPLDTGKLPHVCDMSSDFMWRPTDVAPYAFIYAGAQKNLGPSGILVGIINKEFMATGRTDIPKIFRYATQADNDSLYNTPPTLAVYLMKNVLEWMESMGGLPAMEKRNQQKADLLYGALDAMSDFYKAPVEKASRSVMNVVFRLASESLEAQFVKAAESENMVGLKGHRVTGGIRVSTYNAVSVEDVTALVSFMKQFAAKHG